jgi:hypothetical protein
MSRRKKSPLALREEMIAEQQRQLLAAEANVAAVRRSASTFAGRSRFPRWAAATGPVCNRLPCPQCREEPQSTLLSTCSKAHA